MFFAFTTFASWQIPNTNPGTSSSSFLSAFNATSSSQQKTGALIIDEGFRSLGPVLFSATSSPLKILASGYGAGKVLTSDANGFVAWSTPNTNSNNGWTKAGNLVSLSSNAYNINLGTNPLFYKGGTTSAYRFIYSTLNYNFFAGLGSGTLDTNFTGNENTIVGVDSGKSFNAQNPHKNSALGYRTLYNFANLGYSNEAIGFQAMLNATNGVTHSNSAAGYAALINTNGAQANVGIGSESLPNLTTGYSNTGLGALSLKTNQSGSYNTAIGYDTSISNGIINSTVIGHNIGVTVSNKIRIGNPDNDSNPNNGGATAIIEGQVPYSVPSDLRLKENINDTDLGLEFIKRLRPVSYKMKAGTGTDYGFIAQEVETAIGKPTNIVLTDNTEFGMKTLNYSGLISPLVKSIQEEQLVIENYKKQIEEYEKRVEYLENLKKKN